MINIIILRLKILLSCLRNKTEYNLGQLGKKNIFIFLGADYGNLGDVAITYAQTKYLKEHFQDYNVVEIPISQTAVNPAKRNVLDLKNETCKNREKRNVLKISHTRHFKTTKKQSKTGCFYSF